jgi:hypothetical protein
LGHRTASEVPVRRSAARRDYLFSAENLVFWYENPVFWSENPVFWVTEAFVRRQIDFLARQQPYRSFRLRFFPLAAFVLEHAADGA